MSEETINSETGEVETSLPAIPASAPMPMQTASDLLANIGAKVVKQVTRTVLQQVDGVPFAVTFETEAAESQVVTPARGSAAKMAAARVCDVLNLVTGSHQILIMNTVLEGELDRSYPKAGYVGKSFMIRSHFPIDDSGKKRRYKVYEIIEIEMDGNTVKTEPVADGTAPVNRKGDKPKG